MCIVLVATVPFLSGCQPQTATEVVTKVEKQLRNIQPYLDQAEALATEFREIDPAAADEVIGLVEYAKPVMAKVIDGCDVFLSKPSGDNYQVLLNAADAITAGVDAKTLNISHIKNSASRTRALLISGLIDTGLHVIVGVLEQNASKSQIKAMPKIAGRADFEQVRPFLNRPFAEQEIAALGYDPAVLNGF